MWQVEMTLYCLFYLFVLESTKILNELEGGSVVDGFLNPVIWIPIFCVFSGQELPSLEHHSMKVKVM